jgi:hypothetical protein
MLVRTGQQVVRIFILSEVSSCGLTYQFLRLSDPRVSPLLLKSVSKKSDRKFTQISSLQFHLKFTPVDLIILVIYVTKKLIFYTSLACDQGKVGENEAQNVMDKCDYRIQLEQSDLEMKAQTNISEM